MNIIDFVYLFYNLWVFFLIKISFCFGGGVVVLVLHKDLCLYSYINIITCFTNKEDLTSLGFPGGSVVKNPSTNAGDKG